MVRMVGAMVGVFVCLLTTSPALGHTVFKKHLEKKFPTVRVSCEACHNKGKPKTERNEFGELFFAQMKDSKLTEQWSAFGDDRAGKTKFEKEVMLPAFEKAWEAVKQQKNKDEATYETLLKDVKLPGLKAKKAGEKAKDDDDEDGEDDKLPQTPARSDD